MIPVWGYCVCGHLQFFVSGYGISVVVVGGGAGKQRRAFGPSIGEVNYANEWGSARVRKRGMEGASCRLLLVLVRTVGCWRAG